MPGAGACGAGLPWGFARWGCRGGALRGGGPGRVPCRGGLPMGPGRGLCVGRGGSCAAVACLAGAAGAGPLLPGLARRWAWRGPLPSWPALPGWPALGPLALRRAFRGARGRGSVVHCLQWCASGVRRGGLCAARSGVRCLAWAVLPGCGLPGANNNPTNIAKNQCRANINHNILSPQHAISPRPSQKVCRGSLPE